MRKETWRRNRIVLGYTVSKCFWSWKKNLFKTKINSNHCCNNMYQALLHLIFKNFLRCRVFSVVEGEGLIANDWFIAHFTVQCSQSETSLFHHVAVQVSWASEAAFFTSGLQVREEKILNNIAWILEASSTKAHQCKTMGRVCF